MSDPNGGERHGPGCPACGSPLISPCPACAAPMPAAFHFCGYCGAGLQVTCPGCGAGMPRDFRFCGRCGTAMGEGAKPPSPSRGAPVAVSSGPSATPVSTEARALVQPDSGAKSPEPVQEERRRVAILFADLSGSTAMADRLDPETCYQIVSSYLAGLGRIVTEAGGYVVKTLGDGIMAVFGAPVAHGDDPVRAGRAALQMQEWMSEYGEAVRAQHDVALQCRIGINYGTVVAAPIAAGDRLAYDILGDAVNVAQRAESAAAPGSVAVTEAFYRVTRGRFEFRDRGAAVVKGKPEPLHLYELGGLREDGLQERLLPLVGREPELEQLHRVVRCLSEDESTGGACRVVALAGAGGMGKSRLLDELAADLEAEGLPFLRGAGSEGERHVPLALWRAWLRALLPLEERDTLPEAEAKVSRALGDPEHAVWAEWLAAITLQPERLLSLPAEARAHVLGAALGVFLEFWSGGRPAAILIDEADTVDPLSLHLLRSQSASAAGGSLPLLVVMAGRESSAYPPPDAVVIGVGPLAPESVRRLLTEALHPHVAPEELALRVADRSGGSPLFLDLMLRTARETPDPLDALDRIPDSVYGIVRAELDALTPQEHETAQSASVLGRSFPERWLKGLRAPGAADGSGPIRELERRDVLGEARPEPHRELAFRLGAVPEVLYEGMLTSRRAAEHAAAAALIGREAVDRPELAAAAALHWLRADVAEEAMPSLLQAAGYASSVYAGEEARELYERCLELAERVGDPAVAARAALGLGQVMAHTGAFPEALELFARAEGHVQAAGSSGSPELLSEVLLERSRALARTGAVSAASPVLARALELAAAASGDGARRRVVQCLVEKAHQQLDLCAPGEALAAARAALEEAETAGWTVEATAAGSALGRVYPALGDWPSAERELRKAAERAEALGDWQGVASCLLNLGTGLQSRGRLTEATGAFQRALEYAERIGDAEKIAIGRMALGVVELNLGRWSAAERDLRAALEQFSRMDHALGVAACRCNLAETLRLSGESARAEAELLGLEVELAEIDAVHLGVHAALCRAELELAAGGPGDAEEAARAALSSAMSAEYESGINLARLGLGRILRALERLTEAEVFLSDAVDGFAGTGERLEEARARAELAAVLALQGNPHADALLQSARASIIELGAEPWLAQLPGSGAASRVSG